MNEIAGLIREFPVGAFFLIILTVWAVERMVVAGFSRNRPIIQKCDCENCCEDEDEDEEEE